jgi:protein associated with RNAse G/E
VDVVEVLVSVRKYDGSAHWRYSAVRLGEDDHGIWLGVRVGTAYGKGAEEVVYRTREPRVVLIPRDAWWTALFQAGPALLDVYCDVTTPSRWPHPHEVTVVDLDLDVCRSRAGDEVFVVDEDEFAVHRVRYGYPAEVVERATASADWLRAALGAGVEPFAGDFRAWLAKAG